MRNAWRTIATSFPAAHDSLGLAILSILQAAENTGCGGSVYSLESGQAAVRISGQIGKVVPYRAPAVYGSVSSQSAGEVAVCGYLRKGAFSKQHACPDSAPTAKIVRLGYAATGVLAQVQAFKPAVGVAGGQRLRCQAGVDQQSGDSGQGCQHQQPGQGPRQAELAERREDEPGGGTYRWGWGRHIWIIRPRLVFTAARRFPVSKVERANEPQPINPRRRAIWGSSAILLI